MWRGASGAGTLAAYQAYIKEFPSGLFADLANAKINQLRGSGGELSSGETNSGASLSAKGTTVQNDLGDAQVDDRQGSERDLTFIPPSTAQPDLPALPPTPVLPAEGYPDGPEN